MSVKTPPSYPSPLRSIHDLREARFVSSKDNDALAQVARRYAIAVTPQMANLIDPNDEADPIARQFIPTVAELTVTAEERADPIGDLTHSPVKGIVHRYPDRVLLKPLHVCPVYCRFCFRREQVGPGGEMLDEAQLETALDYIAQHKEIFEVIVTGGDPLMLSPRRLQYITQRISNMEHVQVLRFHTRVPVVDPARITPELVAALQASGIATFLAIHANHTREFSKSAGEAIAQLANAGIPLLGQSVLLKGVNDSVTALTNLFRTMLRHRIKPYYLHHPDLAPGTAHFRLSLEEGRALVRTLRGQISGLAQPTYVLDIPGGYGKSPLSSDYVHDDPKSGAQVEDWRGQRHAYPPATRES